MKKRLFRTPIIKTACKKSKPKSPLEDWDTALKTIVRIGLIMFGILIARCVIVS